MPYLRRQGPITLPAGVATEVVPTPPAGLQRRVIRLVSRDDGGNAAEAEVSVILASPDITGSFTLDYAFEPISAAVGAAGNVAISRVGGIVILPGESIQAVAATAGSASVTWVDEPLD